ncbi:uncharacterized protein BJ171DRAFT_128001 [Polychytrium aggregatum]|uniref:uncharacterized protein n=1 Tax=Polychytrium aggregatum TaxID=110093 RepID=UPI0022FF2774|nr:uncharacterized protein BJ171DRAFT_128001 [Polychytrium aggregatum]KAI9204049.1 hypothetical protein BJ171DRAFT_128001 [Polychytrium aggregatum]
MALSKLHLAAVASLALFALEAQAQACSPYNGTVCASVLAPNATYATLAPVPAVEAALSQNFTSPLATTLQTLNPTCAKTILASTCHQAFLTCGTTQVYLPCKSSCDAVVGACQSTFSSAGMLQMLPNCSSSDYGTTNCISLQGNLLAVDVPATSPPSTPSAGTTLPICPPPLIADPNPSSNNSNCMSGCCLPCPKERFFYQPGLIDKLELGFKVIFLISFVCFLLVAVSTFSTRRGRAFPRIFTGFFSACGAAMMLVTFGTYPSYSTMQCASDGISDATQANNIVCLATGIVFVYMLWTLIFWVMAIIFAMHMMIVWGVEGRVLVPYSKYFHIVAWIVPVAMTVAVVLKNELRAYPGNICLPGNSLAIPLFYGPQVIIAGLCVLLHLGTAIKILWVGIKASRSSSESWLRKQIRLQWRSGMLVVVFSISYIGFILTNVVYLMPMLSLTAQEPWIQKWVLCLIQNSPNGVQTCLPLVVDHVPPIIPLATWLVVTLAIGVWVALVMLPGQPLFKDQSKNSVSDISQK